MCGVCVFTDVYSHGMHIPLSLHSGWFGPLAFRSVLLCVCVGGGILCTEMYLVYCRPPPGYQQEPTAYEEVLARK